MTRRRHQGGKLRIQPVDGEAFKRVSSLKPLITNVLSRLKTALLTE